MKTKYIISLFIIIVITAGIFVYLQTRKLKDFEPQIIARLQSLVREGTDSLYRLSIEGLEVDVVKARIGVLNASLEVDSSILTKMDSAKIAPNDIFSISLRSLYIDGLGPADLLNTKTIRLKMLDIENPFIEVFQKKRKYNPDTSSDTSSLYQKLSGQISTFSVDSLSVNGATFIHHNLSPEKKKSELKNVSLSFKNILIDSSTAYDTSRFLFAKKALITLKDYSFRTPDKFYFLKADSISISAPSNMMQISGASLKPAMSKAAFIKATGFRKELFDITINDITVDSINWWSLLNKEGLTAGTVNITDSRVKVYLDRSLPAPAESKVGNYPHQLLMKLKLPVKIDRINVKNLDLSYEEYNPKSEKSATIYFDNASGIISNITNNADAVRKDPYMKASVRTFFMHKSPLQSSFTFDLAQYKKGNFSVDMQVTKIDQEQLKEITNNLGMLSLESVNIKSLQAHVDGSDVLGKGKVLLLYDNLRIVPLKKDGDSNGGLKQRNLRGFLMNALIVKDENPSGNKEPRKATGEFVRETDRSFFNLVWKTILVGILQTVGANPKLAESK